MNKISQGFRISVWVGVSAIWLALAACGGSQPVAESPSSARSMAVEKTENNSLRSEASGKELYVVDEHGIPVSTLDTQRQDIQAVIMAVVYNMQGIPDTGIGPVLLDEKIGRIRDGSGVLYNDFRVAGVVITRDIARLGESKYRELSFILEWVDPGWRRAFVEVTANYYLAEKLIFLEKVEAHPLISHRQSVRVYYLPAKGSPPLDVLSEMSFPVLAETLYLYALSPEELSELPAGQMSRLKVVAVHEYRMHEQAALRFSIVGDDKAHQALVDQVKYWSVDGWPIAAAEGVFLMNGDPGFELEVSLMPNAKAPNVLELISRYPSRF
jgi:hypothetical protein